MSNTAAIELRRSGAFVARSLSSRASLAWATRRTIPLHSAAWLLVAFVGAACKDEPPQDHAPAHGDAVAGSGGAAAIGASAGSSAAAAVSGATAGNTSATLPDKCVRAAGLDGPDSPRTTCLSRNAFLRCDIGEGAAKLCVSDDPTHCPYSAGVQQTTCRNQCAANEYAVMCGALMIYVEPPAGCRGAPPTPGGVVFYCCPCGS